MSIAQRLLLEFDDEARTTRRVLDRVPADHLSWQPHPTALTLGQLALHVAATPAGVSAMAQLDACEVPKFEYPAPASHAEILAAQEQSEVAFRRTMSTMNDSRMTASWSLARGPEIVWTIPRVVLFRIVGMNHVYHHRGQLTMYLRMLGVPVPAVYGISRDENPFA